MNTSSRSKKFLAPLAVLLAAGALAVGSGATFTSASSNTANAVTAGTLEHTNDQSGAIFTASNIKPKDTVTGSLTITNTGSLDATFSLAESDVVNGFSKGMLNLVVTNDTLGTTVYSGEFGELAAKDLGVIEAGTANEFTFAVTLHTDAPNADQGETASATYSWKSTQLNP